MMDGEMDKRTLKASEKPPNLSHLRHCDKMVFKYVAQSDALLSFIGHSQVKTVMQIRSFKIKVGIR